MHKHEQSDNGHKCNGVLVDYDSGNVEEKIIVDGNYITIYCINA